MKQKYDNLLEKRGNIYVTLFLSLPTILILAGYLMPGLVGGVLLVAALPIAKKLLELIKDEGLLLQREAHLAAIAIYSVLPLFISVVALKRLSEGDLPEAYKVAGVMLSTLMILGSWVAFLDAQPPKVWIDKPIHAHRIIRDLLGKSIAEVSLAAQVSDVWILDVEHLNTRPEKARDKRYARALGISYREFLTLKDLAVGSVSDADFRKACLKAISEYRIKTKE